MPAARPELACGRWQDDALLLPVRVQPRSGRIGLGPLVGDRLRLALTAPPVDGKANAQAREVLAETFGVSAARVTLVRGDTGRDKLFRIDQPRRLPPVIRRS
ncbi:MAG: DUF167 family protein [Gammaproteobacteria bacterium]|nr:MAG: DUF167 family protein [Gammaproteobacteria bacterium]